MILRSEQVSHLVFEHHTQLSKQSRKVDSESAKPSFPCYPIRMSQAKSLRAPQRIFDIRPAIEAQAEMFRPEGALLKRSSFGIGAQKRPAQGRR